MFAHEPPVPSIGLDDSFFQLGGDSIAAIKLVGEARTAGINLTVADLFRCPTLAAFSDVDRDDLEDVFTDNTPFSLLDPSVDIAQVCEEAARSTNIDAHLIENIYPCSPLQEGLISLTTKRAGEYVMRKVLGLRADQMGRGREPRRVYGSRHVNLDGSRRHAFTSLPRLMDAIGTSIASVSWVADPRDHNKLAPLGSVGELLVEGPILARGYPNDLKKTAAVFINNPAWLLEGWAGHSGRQGGLYKTGDLVRYNANGDVVCLGPAAVDRGRADDATAIIGARVLSVEVESLELDDSFFRLGGDSIAAIKLLSSANPCSPLQEGLMSLTAKRAGDYSMQDVLELQAGVDKDAFCAAWEQAIVAGRYTSSGDVVPTIATVPVRVRVQSDQTIFAFLQDLQQQATDMIAYEQMGLQRIAKMGARPNAPAIFAWDGELTYGELDALSTKLAGHLTQLGVKPEDVVPLCFEKSMWTLVAHASRP
ncbi:hypothetical protein P3342_005008 [Pyrenophora teres f. teres]|nr:hypothetical protein P3342_005008 [Pyrenophora teres f. teres]